MTDLSLAGEVHPRDLDCRTGYSLGTKIARMAIPFGIGCARRESDGSEECSTPATAEDVTRRFRGVHVKPDTWMRGRPGEAEQGTAALVPRAKFLSGTVFRISGVLAEFNL